MEGTKPWIKYLNTLGVDDELLSVYLELRHAFKREGWSEEDLKKPPYYPQDIMYNFQKFSSLQSSIFFELKSFFGIDFNEFTDYLQNKLHEIDKQTPLNDGN